MKLAISRCKRLGWLRIHTLIRTALKLYVCKPSPVILRLFLIFSWLARDHYTPDKDMNADNKQQTERLKMSGGEFNYLQYRIEDCSEDVLKKIEDYEQTCTEQTLKRFKECSEVLAKAALMLHRVDWFVSSGDGEETFNSKWDAEIGEYK